MGDIYNSLQQHTERIAPAIRALEATKLTSAADLLDHLTTTTVAHFVTTCANSKELPEGYRECYQRGANDLSDLMATDPTAL